MLGKVDSFSSKLLPSSFFSCKSLEFAFFSLLLRSKFISRLQFRKRLSSTVGQKTRFTLIAASILLCNMNPSATPQSLNCSVIDSKP